MKNKIKNILYLIPSIIITIIIVNIPTEKIYYLVENNGLMLYLFPSIITLRFIKNSKDKYYLLGTLLIINSIIVYFYEYILINKILILNILLAIIAIIYYQVLSKLKLRNYYALVLIFCFPIIQNYFSFQGFNNDINMMFTFAFAMLFSLLIFNSKKWIRVTLFNVIFIALNLIIMFQNLNYQILSTFFSFFDIYNFSEATDFVSIGINVFLETFNIGYLISIMFIFIGNMIVLKEQEIMKIKSWGGLLVIALIIRFGTITLLYEEQINTYTSIFSYNISSYITYERFTDRYNAMHISGVYEYTYQDLMSMLFGKSNSDKSDLIEFINSNNKEVTNEMSGIFKDDNVIVILAETLDTWVVDDQTMPTLSKMTREGIKFNNFYALNYNGGRTHNSGFTLNTGFYIPTNYNIYESTVNEFDYSLPELFNQNGYKTTSIHANDGEFYARKDFHKAWGYQNSYFLEDYKNSSRYFNDVNLLDDDIYDLYVDKDNKFMSFIITYIGHGGYVDNKYCKMKNIEEQEPCYRYLINLTDQFLKGLIDRLTEDELIDETTIVIVSDHYSYTYSDQEYLKQQKNVVNKHDVERVPFIIWNNSIKPQEINSYVETSDILPTIYNLFDINYNPDFYMGDDIFSSTFDNYLLLNDDTLVNSNTKKELEYALKNKDYGASIVTQNISLIK